MSAEQGSRTDGRDVAIHATLARLLPDAPQMGESETGMIHSGTVRRVETIWSDVPSLRESPTYAELLGEPNWRERWVDRADRLRDAWRGLIPRRPAFAMAAAALALSAVAVPWSSLVGPGGHYETALAETREIRLADGSIVTLGAKSAVDVDFDGDHRIVRLTSGEAFFAVAKDRRRPFEVLAGDTHIRVTGTRFNVNHSGQGVRVAVLEGTVQLTEQATGATVRNISLAAGQQFVAQQAAYPDITAPGLSRITPEIGVPQVTALSIATPGGWRTGNLAYENVPLGQIVADANRYYEHEIRIASAKGSGMRITTSFRAGQVEDFLDTVERALPLKVVLEHDGDIVIADQ